MFQLLTAPNKTFELELQLAPNEFYAYDNKVGILVQDPDPVQFLTIENKNSATKINEIILSSEMYGGNDRRLQDEEEAVDWSEFDWDASSEGEGAQEPVEAFPGLSELPGIRVSINLADKTKT